jgi:hemerythrin
MFEWNDSYSVKIGSVDQQHQKLFEIAEELHTAMASGKGKPALEGVLQRLVEYTAMHFAHEERLMRLHDYPGAAQHMAEHSELKRQVLDFQKEFRAGRTSLTVDLMIFLRTWLQKHIKGSDMRYAPHFRDRAVA